MSESKRPIYAYVDETGNTGHNLFDKVQPDFFTCALVTKGDFDIAYGEQTRKIAATFGANSLHGKDLGVHRLEQVSGELLKLLKVARANFFVSRVEKKYLLATKLFDSLFDSGENAAVGWHTYNIRPLRLILAFKVAALIDEQIAKDFWACILEPKEDKAYEALPKVCKQLLGNIDRITDARSRELISEALTWARTHPESIQIYVDKKVSRQGHFPNLVAFANLLAGLENFSQRFRVPVARISHDQQGEFQKTIGAWHSMFSNASPEKINWAGEVYSLQMVPGSLFSVLEDSQSPGIQIADIVIWLYAQFRKGKDLPPGCVRLIQYVLSNGWENDFSFSGVSRMLTERFGGMLARPLTPEVEAEARSMLATMESNRQASMARYEQDQLPPFMHSSKVLPAKDSKVP